MTTRTPGQCKSHHQKKHLTEDNVLHRLAKFISDYYEGRALDPRQAVTEFERHLRQSNLRTGNSAETDASVQVFG